MKNIAFIPARSGSKRIPDKNIKKLLNKPLLTYTIESAINSGYYERVFIVTDSKKYADIAIKSGAELLKLRPTEISEDNSPDIEWVRWMFKVLEQNDIEFDTFSILRPTSPFRKKGEIFYKPISYSATKSSVYNITRYLSVYWAKKNVRVNTLTLAGVFNNQEEDFLKNYCDRIPIGRMANPEDYFGAIHFLSSDMSKYMTGSNLIIDGGWTSI